MSINSSIQLAHNQSSVQFFTLVNDKYSNELYIKSNIRYLGVECTQNGFPVNGIVIDFSYLKLAMKEIIMMLQGKLILCANSTLYTVNLVDENLVVRTKNHKVFMNIRTDCFVSNFERFSDQEFCRMFSVCLETIVKSKIGHQKFFNAKVKIMKIKNNQKVQVADSILDI